jgi:hypothetical protein
VLPRENDSDATHEAELLTKGGFLCDEYLDRSAWFNRPLSALAHKVSAQILKTGLEERKGMSCSESDEFDKME